ncbi:hypothetical protein RQP46_007507 [Phenoliferia psychrophenolica]
MVRSPIMDVTNTPSDRLASAASASSSSSSSQRYYKQASLFDMFGQSASSSSALTSEPGDPPTSPCATSSSYKADREDDPMLGLGDAHQGDSSYEGTGTRSGKRRRASESVDDDDREADARAQLPVFRLSASASGANEGERRIPSLFNTPGHQIGVHAMLQRRGLGLTAGPKQISMRPLLRGLVSNNEEQVYRCRSEQQARMWAPPFALQFSRGAKAGGRQLFAVADEEGTVGLVNGSEDSRHDEETGRTSFKAHHNAIFDLAWSDDDSMIATASGDQTVKIWDAETRTCTGVLAGHTCTIKNVTWDPFSPHMLATASRDGSIRVWDRRVPGPDLGAAAGGGSVETVNMLKNAHGTKGKASKGRSATKSVTSVAYLKHKPNLLASSGSSDSLVKVWDLRKSHKRRVNPEHLESNEDAVAETGTARPHGISNMALSPNGQKIFALSTDSRVYAFDALNLTQPEPLGVYSHPKASCGTFYVRLALSPCSRYLATGSSDGAAYVWDTEGNGKDAVRVVGHEKEVSGLDWGHETMATCSDDELVRVWSFKQGIAQQAREEKEVRWRWSGEDDDEALA